MKTLRDTERLGKRVFLTGGTGYLGSLIAAQTLLDGWADHVVIPTRRSDAGDGMPEEVRSELVALGADPDRFAAQVSTVRWAGGEHAGIDDLRAMLVDNAIDTVIHCAGCLDYFDEAALRALNIEFTGRLVDASKQSGIGLFAFVSTAYAAGYSDAPVPETALDDPRLDPTHYTSTKRAAERIVAAGGMPYLIVRPSIVIGRASDGAYTGKRYGVYQQWIGVERLLSDRYHTELHTVATDQPLNVLHQDAFQNAMSSILRWVPDGAHVNLVTCGRTAPGMKAMWRMICDFTRPRTVYFHEHLRHIDMKTLHLRQRSYLTFARTNLEIGAYPWRFDREWIDLLRTERGLAFTDTTFDTVQVCYDRFTSGSANLQRYREKFADQFPEQVRYVDVAPPTVKEEELLEHEAH